MSYFAVIWVATAVATMRDTGNDGDAKLPRVAVVVVTIFSDLQKAHVY